MKSLVSILIPCYNGENFLERCFKSILSQTYSNIEIIFINDGSVDNSEEIAKEYANKLINKGYKFNYIYQENSGAAAAINVALKLVNGEYIMLYDIDDIIFPTAVEEKAVYLDNNKEYDMVRNNGYYVNNDNLDKIVDVFSRNEEEKKNENIFEALLLGETNNWPASFMVRSVALFDNINDKNIYVSQFGQNLQIMLPVAYKGRSGYIDKPLMKYVRHNKSHSSFINSSRKLELFNGYEENRIQILNSLSLDLSEKKQYIEKINILYFRIRMKIAYESNNRELLIGQYNNLKKMKACNSKDRILYMRGINKFIDSIFNIYEIIIRLKQKIEERIN